FEAFGEQTIQQIRSLPLSGRFDGWLEQIYDRLQRMLTSVADRVADLLVGAFSSLVDLALAPVLAFYLLRDWPRIAMTLTSALPRSAQPGFVAGAAAVDKVLSGFVRGQLLISLIVGLLTAVGLALLNVKFAILLGAIVGLFNIVPYFGPVIGGVPAVLMALLNSPATALWAAVLLVAVNQFEAAFLSPKIIGDTVGLHPLA